MNSEPLMIFRNPPAMVFLTLFSIWLKMFMLKLSTYQRFQITWLSKHEHPPICYIRTNKRNVHNRQTKLQEFSDNESCHFNNFWDFCLNFLSKWPEHSLHFFDSQKLMTCYIKLIRYIANSLLVLMTSLPFWPNKYHCVWRLFSSYVTQLPL